MPAKVFTFSFVILIIPQKKVTLPTLAQHYKTFLLPQPQI